LKKNKNCLWYGQGGLNISPFTISSNLSLLILFKIVIFAILTEYEITSLKDLFGIYFYFFIQEIIWIKKCKNCGNYFIPTNRFDEKYCDNISPQKPDKTCKQYAVKRTYTDSIASDPIKNAYSHVANFYRVKRTRAKQKNDLKIFNKINTILDKFKNDYDKHFKKYKKKLLSEEELVNWIYSQKKDIQ